ncbi:MAG TPA: phosphoesterase [Clostridiales bacterium]|nr:MAG: hypothetical protein A2Y22_01945 [Clostridiales bacterium GWD2_32_59]HAN09296.1 phosphoesterase [Clostridiales bacterium]
MNYKNVEAFVNKYMKAIYIFFLLLILINMIWLIYQPQMAIVSICIIGVFYSYYLFVVGKFKKNIYKLMSKYEDQITEYKKDANLNAPIPYMVIDIHGEVKWVNNKCRTILNNKKMHEENISTIFPDINVEDIIESQEITKEILLNNKRYRMEKQILKVEEEGDEVENLIALYLLDITEYNRIKSMYENDKIIVGYLFIDNFQEIIDSIEDVKSPMLIGIIERKIGRLGQNMDAIIKKIERDKFMIIFHKIKLEYLLENKFDILDDIRKVSIGNELPVTLSIGIGVGANNLIGTSEYAKEALDLAIGRGGDQAIIKENEKYEFFGGKNKKEVEVATGGKARARIKAYAFRELVNTVDRVIIMGHKNPDLDSLGAALGMYRAVELLGKKAHIVLNEVTAAIESLFERIETCGEYERDTFIKTAEALQKFDDDTLLVIVDVNHPNYVDAPKLLEVAKKIVVIDHHIKSGVTIENPTLAYQEAYASSASELVTQLIQYVSDKVELKEVEVDALIAGMIVDTKNFTFKTGVKTFEAAAFLRRNGADSTRVKVLFQNDLNSYKARAEAISTTEIYKEHFAIAVLEARGTNDYMVISQLADELLNITGVKASFVLCHEGNKILLSSRSLGEMNVELIAEKLGGGGHFTAAGAQIKGVTLEETRKKLKKSIDEYYKED